MKIGIIGAGKIGGALTRQFRKAGHNVSIANSRGPETLADLVSETGARAETVGEVVLGSDLVIVTIQLSHIPDLPEDLLDQTPHDLVVVDTCNYLPRQRDGRIDGIEEGLAESRWVGQQLDHPVIKAFNNIRFEHLENHGRSSDDLERIALPIAGDDPDAKAIVMDLVDEIGFDPIDSGSIDESWRQQPGSLVYGTDLTSDGVRRALAEASHERQADWKATPDSPGTYESPV